MGTKTPLGERELRRLRLRDLRILTTVARTGSMGRAAAQLALSQPAVSKAIAGMELMLGVSLLDRRPRGVEPTLYGRALVKWAAAAFDDLRQGMREIELLNDPDAGEVRIGSHEVMSAALLPAVIEKLSRQYPRLVFTVSQAATIPALYEDLRERRVDFIFGRMMAAVAHDDLNAEELFGDPLVIVGGVRSKWLRRRSVDLAELVDEPWCLTPEELPISPFVAAAFRKRGLRQPRIVVRSNSVHLWYAMIHSGRFVALAPASTVRLSGKRLGLRPLPIRFSVQPGSVGIVTLKNRTISPVAQRFIDCAREFCKTLAWDD
jgi:DNA-binding transcriptional LysR family regulator